MMFGRLWHGGMQGWSRQAQFDTATGQAMGQYVQRTLMSSSPILLLAAVSGGLAIGFLLLGALTNDMGASELVAIGWSMFAVICFAVWSRKTFDVFEPIVPMAISTFIGGTLRSMYIAWSPRDYSVIQFLVGDMTPADLVQYEFMVPIALASMALGYLMWRGRAPIERLPLISNTRWPPVRVLLIAGAYALVGLLGVYLLVKSTGVSFTGLVGLSAKRTVDLSSQGGDQYAHAGYLRWLAVCLKVSLLIVYMAWVSRKDANGNPRPFGPVRAVILGGLVFACMVWPILSSSRTAVIEIVFSLLVMYVYTRNRGNFKRFFRICMVVLVFALVVLIGMGLWRNISQRGSVTPAPFLQTAADQSLGSGNFLPAERAAFIMAKYKDKPFLYGSSYFVWLAMPIPKAIWPDRPDISDMNDFVKGQIYGRDVLKGGYPPGMVGEAYINFGYWGVIFIPFLLGALQRFVYVSFKPLLGVNRNATLLYAAILWEIGFQVADLNVSLLMANVITTMLPLLLAFAFMKKEARVAVAALEPARPAILKSRLA